ncbi:hypothetical protein [Blastococcus sp. SYSU DS0533]
MEALTAAAWVSAPLEWPAWALAVALFAVTPGMHALLSLVAERRLVRPRDDYAAVLVGDPLLALAGGLAASAYAGPVPWARSWWAVAAAVAIGWTYGAAQLRQEVSTGRYLRVQAFAPSKLWHQFAVYPLVGLWLTGAVVSALAARPVNAALVAGAAACIACWAATTVHAVRHPKLGHGGFDWRRGRPVPVGLAEGRPVVLPP